MSVNQIDVNAVNEKTAEEKSMDAYFAKVPVSEVRVHQPVGDSVCTSCEG